MKLLTSKHLVNQMAFLTFKPKLKPEIFSIALRGTSLRAVHPVHHAGEGLSGLAAVVEALLLVVEVGVVDAGGAGHEEVAVPGDLDEAAVGRRGLLVAELADVAEEDGRREVALDVGLLEGLDLAGEGVLHLQLAARLENDSIANI